MYKPFTIDCKSLLYTACRCKTKKCTKDAAALLEHVKALLVAPSNLRTGGCIEQFGKAFFAELRASDKTVGPTCAVLAIDSKSVIFDNVMLDSDWILKKKAAKNRTLSIYSIDMRDSQVHGFLSAVPIKKIIHSMPIDEIVQSQRRASNKKTIILSTRGLVQVSSDKLDAMDVSIPERTQAFVSCTMCSETSGILQDLKLDANKIKYTCSEFLDSILCEYDIPEKVSLNLLGRVPLLLAEFDSLCTVSKHWIGEYKRIGDTRNMCRIMALQVSYLCDFATLFAREVNQREYISPPPKRKPLYKIVSSKPHPSSEDENGISLSKFTLAQALSFFETMFEMFDLKGLATDIRRSISEGLYQMMSLLCWMGENNAVHDMRERLHQKFAKGSDTFKKVSERSVSSKNKRGYAFLESSVMHLADEHLERNGEIVYQRCPRCKNARFYEFNFFETRDPMLKEDMCGGRAVPTGKGSFLTFSFPLPAPSTFHRVIAAINKTKRFALLPWESHMDRRMPFIRQELFETTRYRKHAVSMASAFLGVPRVNFLSSPGNLLNLRCRTALEILMKDRERLPKCMKEAMRDIYSGSDHWPHPDRVFIVKMLSELFFTEEDFADWLHSEGVKHLYIKEVMMKTKDLWGRVLKDKENSEFKLGSRLSCKSLMRYGGCPYFKDYPNEEAAFESCATHLQRASGYTRRPVYPVKHPALFIQKLAKLEAYTTM